MFVWVREKSTAERGFGIAGGTEKGGIVATCAEVGNAIFAATGIRLRNMPMTPRGVVAIELD
jgi:CO/xanthine dehydrogenase Mo-binding subunit